MSSTKEIVGKENKEEKSSLAKETEYFFVIHEIKARGAIGVHDVFREKPCTK